MQVRHVRAAPFVDPRPNEEMHLLVKEGSLRFTDRPANVFLRVGEQCAADDAVGLGRLALRKQPGMLEETPSFPRRSSSD